jgi:preprotein translocase subunit SecE
MTKVVNYISEAFEELKSNVTWPEWSEVQRLDCCCCFFQFIRFGRGVDEILQALLFLTG